MVRFVGLIVQGPTTPPNTAWACVAVMRGPRVVRAAITAGNRRS
jgi:hypothetical protein